MGNGHMRDSLWRDRHDTKLPSRNFVGDGNNGIVKLTLEWNTKCANKLDLDYDIYSFFDWNNFGTDTLSSYIL